MATQEKITTSKDTVAHVVHQKNVDQYCASLSINSPPSSPSHYVSEFQLCTTQVFNAEWDDEGVYFYQAYPKEIAGYALEHQRFGGKHWKEMRMTWIKPSFAWMLYRSGYGEKSGQEIILKIKLGHSVLAELLKRCKPAIETREIPKCNKNTIKEIGTSKSVNRTSVICFNNIDYSNTIRVGGKGGRVQWDPERDILQPEKFRGKRQPRKLLNSRAIQIGLSGGLSQYYVENILSIENVTELAQSVGMAHRKNSGSVCDEVMPLDRLPKERLYIPALPIEDLKRLGIIQKRN